jgi:hypothetical protein
MVRAQIHLESDRGVAVTVDTKPGASTMIGEYLIDPITDPEGVSYSPQNLKSLLSVLEAIVALIDLVLGVGIPVTEWDQLIFSDPPNPPGSA